MSRWQKTPSGWQKTDGLVPEQKTKVAAPNLALPTAGQLETPTPALDATLEPLVMPPMGEQAAKRAAQLERLAALPKHLRLGVTLAGMRELQQTLALSLQRKPK